MYMYTIHIYSLPGIWFFSGLKPAELSVRQSSFLPLSPPEVAPDCALAPSGDSHQMRFGVWRGAGQLETAEQPDPVVIKEITKDREV